MRKGLILLAVLGLFGLTGGMTPVNINTLQVNSAPSKNSTKVFSKAKVLFANKMRDPEATRFKPNRTVYDLSNGDQIVCGTVNTKNAMGGYVGYKSFYVRLRDDRIMTSMYSDSTDSTMAMNVLKGSNDAASGTIMIQP